MALTFYLDIATKTKDMMAAMTDVEAMLAEDDRFETGSQKAYINQVTTRGHEFMATAQFKMVDQNLLGGIIIITEKPFQIGDWIKSPSVEGIAEDITFRSTLVRTFDGALVIVPNATLSNEPITNWSRMLGHLGSRINFELDSIVMPFLTRSLQFVVMALTVTMILSDWGINVNGVFAGLGLAGLAISMAAQDPITGWTDVLMAFENPARVIVLFTGLLIALHTAHAPHLVTHFAHAIYRSVLMFSIGYGLYKLMGSLTVLLFCN
ncbi:mechanosensitive ion channel [Weissella confusa]|uniref:Mechanosensitive ion channel n=1 Tax=Weissella confusa TaxID=1583 RepID=A0A923SSX2_WEICO|nr:mechanosensitive ion channel [Weissella confusa]